MSELLRREIKYLTGVGEARARLLEREVGVRTIEDILMRFPYRYIDRSRIFRINELDETMESTYVQLRCRVVGRSYVGDGAKKRFVVEVSDASGQAELLWFHGVKWIEKRVELNREYIIFGRPSIFKGRVSMVHPEIEPVEVVLSRKVESSFQGIYSTTEKLSQMISVKMMHTLVYNAWQLIASDTTAFQDPLPEDMRRRLGLITLREAIYNIHFPQSAERLKQAQYRLKFDELLGVQLTIQARRTSRQQRGGGFMFPRVGVAFNTFYRDKLPFALTKAQQRVIKEIRADMISGKQMNRLLQGDVGSGKTMVAFMSMLLAVDNGFQACIMAPTEILARQHYASMCRFAEGLDVRVGIITGSSKAKERRAVLEATASGEVNILVGTHALLEDRVQFANLGYVVIDEQHRFGVEQRAKLWTKNQQPPHILVMTATPIPRTLAMTLYGDLEVSVIDELPPGRQPIRTYHYFDSMRLRMFGFLRQEIAKGRQVYVVYPLIKESEKMDYKDLHDGFESMSRDFPLPQYRIAVCHGKMKPEDKDAAMAQFKSHQADILIATSVIEVGVDVPNATVMVIESAERFGLSQLHQLRGRVGRGGEQSYCILMSGDKLSKDGRARLEAMCATNDGFQLSELDLKLRGAGDIHGTQQSGDAFSLNIANLATDTQIMEVTREEALRILATDATLQRPENMLLRALRDKHRKREAIDFSDIS
ncbi:MAG: ATP-dependent DNA helicase RecG [Alistipes sp.]|jgi:ATP-dependent DNA helicase RecG|nr:ATP-dependent DNA helicase RecG [Alistipes sp.]